MKGVTCCTNNTFWQYRKNKISKVKKKMVNYFFKKGKWNKSDHYKWLHYLVNSPRFQEKNST